MNHNLPKLPLGEQDFAQMRNKEMVYVDKTNFIYQLFFVRQEKFVFFARPRRFGKSLFVSTLKELFLGNQTLFKGLFIENKINWETYPIIHLDFSKMGFKDIGLFAAIEKSLLSIAQHYQVSLENEGIGLKFAELMQKLHKKTGKQAVILIDEYDKPITDVLEVGKNEKAREHREILRTLYSIVKGNSAHIHLFFMTGISRFSKVSIFSDLNNLTDLTKEKDYHNLLGYTQEELNHYFIQYLAYIAKEQNISLEDLLVKVKEWYNGFSWNGQDKLYNPYSILRFLAAREFGNYWFDSGTPKFLIQLLKKEKVYDMSNRIVTKLSVENYDIDHPYLDALFFQTGYLTIKKLHTFDRYILDYPNKEVEQSMLDYILVAFTGNENESALAYQIADAVQNNQLDDLKSTFNAIFASIPYQIFNQNQESFFHAVIFLSLKLCGFYIQSEVNVSTGRADAVMYYENRIYIFEFKLNQSAEAAIAQIHQKGYYKPFLNQGREIYLIAINFSGETKSVEKMITEKLN